MRHVLETNVGRIAAAAVLLTGSALAYATPAAAVPADTVKGCYVNGSGTMYRTSAPNAPSVCAKATHVPMSWPDGKGDDYPRYLPANGVRHSSRGFAVTGALSEGTIPISGPGVRMMWYSGKAAFRAGRVQNSQWENSNIGQYSMALGLNTTASGLASIAFGNGTTASGGSSVALGTNAYAGGESATAIGTSTVATGFASTALGYSASTNGKSGAFVYGDYSPTGNYVMPTTNNQFVVRAQRFWFGTNNNVTATAGRYIETSTGAYLSYGGTWANSSDVARKANFATVEGDAVLAKVAALSIQSWNYKDEESAVRHIGPTAQDFHAAFGLGDTDKAIATVDADGVSLAAIQALEKRSREQAREIDGLKQANNELRERMDRQQAETAAELEALRRNMAELLGARR